MLLSIQSSPREFVMRAAAARKAFLSRICWTQALMRAASDLGYQDFFAVPDAQRPALLQQARKLFTLH